LEVEGVGWRFAAVWAVAAAGSGVASRAATGGTSLGAAGTPARGPATSTDAGFGSSTAASASWTAAGAAGGATEAMLAAVAGWSACRVARYPPDAAATTHAMPMTASPTLVLIAFLAATTAIRPPPPGAQPGTPTSART
jgi:hypothetical protein